MKDIIKGVVKMEKEIEMAKEIAEEALKSAPVIHKTKQELKIEELEGQVIMLTQAFDSFQAKLDDKVNKTDLLTIECDFNYVKGKIL